MIESSVTSLGEQRGMDDDIEDLRGLDFIGAGRGSRTPDLRITNALLYQLSYTGVFARREPARGEP